MKLIYSAAAPGPPKTHLIGVYKGKEFHCRWDTRFSQTPHNDPTWCYPTW